MPGKVLPYNLVRAFKPKDAFGEPRAFLGAMPKDGKGLPVDGTYAKMGVVFGTADGIKTAKREGNDGSIAYFYGLTGTFEAQPVDPTTRNPIRANVAWLPEELQNGIEMMLEERISHKTGEVIKNENGASSVDFAFECGVEASAASSTGFVWRWRSLIELKESGDPLAAIRNAMPSDALALPAPSGTILSSATDGDAAPEDASETGDQEAEVKNTNAKKGGKG